MLRLDAQQGPAPRGDETVPSVVTRPGGRLPVLALRAAVVLALLPVAVATIRALARGWLPVGDNAYFAIRANDVLTEHHPLLGTWTSASLSTGTNFNNPGPLLFDLFALPVKLAGNGAGLAVGAALLNGLAIVGIAVVVARRSGPVAGVLAVVATAALCWSMGSELLFDPWQPHSLLLTSLLLMVLVWSLACGDLVALPWAVGIASLILQTHLSYAVIIVALGAWAAVASVLSLRRRRRDGGAEWPALRRTAGRSVLAAVVVLALCWAQPLAEQLSAEEEGNLSRLVGNAGGSPDTVGTELGIQVVSAVAALPPLFARPSFERTLDPSEEVAEGRPGVRLPDLPSSSLAAASLCALAAVLVACGLSARNRQDSTGLLGLGTAAVAVVAGLVTAMSLPIGFGGIAPHQFRWLWPVSAFTVLVVGACLARARLPARRQDLLAGAGMGVVLLLVLANLPSHNVGAGPVADSWAIPTAQALGRGMGALEGGGPLLIDIRGLPFAEPYSGPVMAELQRRDIPFVVEDEGMVRQLGERRRFDGANAAGVLLIRVGLAVEPPPPGTELVALIEGLTGDEEAELASLRERVVGRLRDEPLRLSAAGEAAVAAGTALTPEGVDPAALLGTGQLRVLVDRDLIDVSADAGLGHDLERLAVLLRGAEDETVAIFVGPLSARPEDQGSS